MLMAYLEKNFLYIYTNFGDEDELKNKYHDYYINIIHVAGSLC